MKKRQLWAIIQRIFILGTALLFSAACKQAHPEMQNLRSLSGFELDQNTVTVARKLNPTFVLTGICNPQYSTIDISLDNGTTWSSVSVTAHQASIDCQNSGKFRLDFSTGLPSTLSNPNTPQLLFRAVSDLGFSEIRSLSILQKQIGAVILAGTHDTNNGSYRMVGRVGGSASAQTITPGYKLRGTVRSQ